jgi:hypothetical protein
LQSIVFEICMSCLLGSLTPFQVATRNINKTHAGFTLRLQTQRSGAGPDWSGCWLPVKTLRMTGNSTGKVFVWLNRPPTGVASRRNPSHE